MSWVKLVIRFGVPLFVLIGIMYPISRFNDLPAVFVAWGTLMLAYATFMLVRHSRESEDRGRKENERIRIKERDREFKRHNLEIIDDWAHQVLIHLREWYPNADKNDIKEQDRLTWSLQLRSISLIQMQTLFDKKFNTRLKVSLDDFNKYSDTIFETRVKVRVGEQVPETDRNLISDAKTKAFGSITNLIYAITTIKIKFKL